MNTRLEYFIKDGYSEMDFDKVTAMLQNAFWSIGIKKEEVIKGAINSALVVGSFSSYNEQIGYARAVSDKTRFAYIMDVFVDERFRKQGIGQSMVKYILIHPDMQDVSHWLLSTKDAHGVYEKVGFKKLGNPEEWMHIRYERTR